MTKPTKKTAIPETTGQRVRRIRTANRRIVAQAGGDWQKEWSQAACAARATAAGYPTTTQNWSAIEKDKHALSEPRIRAAAAGLKVKISTIIPDDVQ